MKPKKQKQKKRLFIDYIHLADFFFFVQVILKMAHNKEDLEQGISDKIDEFATRGYRALGVARSNCGENTPIEKCAWEMVGLMPLYDPPRPDTAATIKSAFSMGIAVKMITGDQLAIARETARQLGMSTDIHTTEFLSEVRSSIFLVAQKKKIIIIIIK